MGDSKFEIINARVTFKNIPIHKISKFSFKDLKEACETFKKINNVSECVILQNPFRIEIFMTVDLESGDDLPDVRREEGKALTINKIEDTWKSLTELTDYDLDHFDQTLEVYKNADVYYYLLRLATGLDSIVVGRTAIIDEIKEAITIAKNSKVSGKVLDKLFDTVIQEANGIREKTGISKGTISIGDVAVKTVDEKAGIDAKKKILLVGTGDIAAMVARALGHKDAKFDVASLTAERANNFSQNLGGTPVVFEEIVSTFDKYDIIIVATTADYFLINYDILKLAMQNKKKGTLILDISDPRAVDEKVSSFPMMKLLFRDQIAEMYEEDHRARQGIVPEVEKLIGEKVPVVFETMRQIETESAAKGEPESADTLRKQELEKALEQLGETDESKIKIIEELTKKIAEKVVSVPSKKTDSDTK